MKKLICCLLAMTLCAGPLSAQNPALEKRFAQALKLYPEADTNGDGELSMPEAMAYLQAHPDVAAELKAYTGGKGEKRKPATQGPVAVPADSTLPLGPRVFVCAHSFMIYTSKLLPEMAAAAEIQYQDAGSQMIGGSQVIQHWDVADEDNAAKKALREGKVDVLTLSPHMLLPDEGIDNFVKLGIEKNPKLRVLVQASWPGRDGEVNGFKNESRNSATLESLRQMHDMYHSVYLKELEAQVTALNASVGHEAVHIVPVCDAVIALREEVASGTAPGLAKQTDLFRDDLGHPLPPLAVLVSYCHFANIFQKSPVGLPVPTSLASNPDAEKLNTRLQEIAWKAVTGYRYSGVSDDSVPVATEAPTATGE